jgi:hypothetical protein
MRVAFHFAVSVSASTVAGIPALGPVSLSRALMWFLIFWHQPVPSGPAPLAALGPAASRASGPEAPNQGCATSFGTNADIMAFSMTKMSQGREITVSRRCSSCSSCYETMRQGLLFTKARLSSDCFAFSTSGCFNITNEHFRGEEHEG